MAKLCTFQIGDTLYCKQCTTPSSIAKRIGERTFEFMGFKRGEKILASASFSEGSEFEITCEKCGSGYIFKDIPELSASV
jgi:hypothetical protein